MNRKPLYIFLLLILAACNTLELNPLSDAQKSLIGRAVNFNASVADEFNNRTKTTYNDKGVFNEDDMMRIYREYWDEDRKDWDATASYRTYIFHTKYATGTSINLGTDWRVAVGRKGYNNVADALHPVGEFIQAEKDSISWENGKTLRFRAWARSNYANSLSGCTKGSYYPDFSVSDWVTMSGPTEQIPLTLRHLTSRIVISPRGDGVANRLHKVEIAVQDWRDYKRIDNADINANDNSATEAGKTDEAAEFEYNQVLAAYNRLCMPAGVDIEKTELYAMTQDKWNSITDEELRRLEEQDAATFYHYGTNDADYVKNNVQRPQFSNVNASCYFITIPYDMSNGLKQGYIVTLPACTRFRVYMYDVNNGDANNTGGYEGTYHIFSLSDIKDEHGNPLFPDGLDMLPGYSYKFRVGYRYNQLTITADDNFAWDVDENPEADKMDADEHIFPTTSTSDYNWWKTAISEAIPTTTGGDFNPVFHISTQKEFIEFINLVNNTAAKHTSGLYRARRKQDNPEHAGNTADVKNWWYTSVSPNKRDTTWITSAQATQDGYLFYQKYYPQNGNVAAFSQEEYIQGAYSFFDETLNRHFAVYLDADLDFYDWELPSVGDSDSTPFGGFFDGYVQGSGDTSAKVHTISNINLKDEYLFKYIDAAAIRNIKINSTHKVSLVKEGKNTCYIVGIDLRAHSTTNSIAERLTSNRYNNPSYVVGCIHVGDAGGALVGASSNLYMLGCMQAAEGITSGDGALVGSHLPYSSENNWKFLAPQIEFNYNKAANTGNPIWSRFMCNYFDTELSPNTWAVGDLGLSTSKDYSPLEYVRGRKSFILKAKNDNLLRGDAKFISLQNYDQRMGFYGLAPWKAMNYAIYRYNSEGVGNTTHTCRVHYVNNSTGYVHMYPELISDVPASTEYDNPLEQNN